VPAAVAAAVVLAFALDTAFSDTTRPRKVYFRPSVLQTKHLSLPDFAACQGDPLLRELILCSENSSTKQTLPRLDFLVLAKSTTRLETNSLLLANSTDLSFKSTRLPT